MDRKEEAPQEQPKQRMPAVVSIVVFMGLFLILSGIAGAVAMVALGIPLDGSATYTLPLHFVLQLCTLVSVLLSAWFVLRILDRRPFSDLGFGWRGKDILYGLLVVLAIYGVGFSVSVGMGVVTVTGFHPNAGDLAWSFVFFTLVSLTEEIMVRGYVLGRLLHTRLNKFVSLGFSSLLFSLMHVFNPNVAFLPLLNIFLAGLFLGAAFLYTRNLWFPISLHLFWNWIQGPVLGYSVSGQTIGKSVLSIGMPEQNIINGGPFGFEGSAVCTVLLIIATGLIIGWYERKERASLFHANH